MSQYRAAFVGCGNRGGDHVAAYEEIDDGVPVACMAPTGSRRDALATEYGMDAYDDVDAMLAEADPDIVHVSTPPDVRVGVMEAVSRAGVPACTVEKPIAVGVEDWRTLRKLASRTGTRFAVCHQFRWHPDFRRCREAVAGGAIGDVRFLDCSAKLVITDQGTHCLHYANAMNGDARIESVYGTASPPFHTDQPHPGPDATHATVAFENGVRAAWTTGTAAPTVETATERYQHKRAAAYGETGHAEWEQFGEWAIGGPDREESGEYGGRERWRATKQTAQAAFHESVFAWLEGGPPPGTELDHSLHEWKAVLALYASALRDTPIALEEFDPPEDLIHRIRTYWK